MGQMTSGKRPDFSDRLKRIEKGGANTAGRIHVGPPSDEELAKRTSKGSKKGRRVKQKSVGTGGSKIGALVALIMATIIGAASYGIAKLGLFHVLSEDGTYSAETYGDTAASLLGSAGDYVGAAIVALILLMVLKVRGRAGKIGAVIGIGLAIYGEQQLRLEDPALYASLTSETYAARQ